MYGQETEIGDVVTYAAFGGEVRTIVVTEASDNIKNGRAGFGGNDNKGGTWWGYDDQIIVITKREDLERGN